MLPRGNGYKGKGMGVPEGNIMQQVEWLEWDRKGRRIRKTDVTGQKLLGDAYSG
jgi:hypothetical protein